MHPKYSDVFMRFVVVSFFALGIYFFCRKASISLGASLLIYIFVLDLFWCKIIMVFNFNIVLFRKIRFELRKLNKKSINSSPVQLDAKITNRQTTVIPKIISMFKNGFSDPKFVLYYDAPVGTTYQVHMWIPYLRLLNIPYVIVGRQLESVSELWAQGIDVRYLKSISDVDAMLSQSSIRAIFYVNNSMRNMHTVRYNDIIHVQMLHGDSDKVTSFNPVCAMYDFLFVAGQLAIDRYWNNGVFINPHKFRIVSRPQAAEISITYRPNGRVQTVFYAPTWSGTYQDQGSSSINEACSIVGLLIMRGYRVIFRPHPLSFKNNEERAIITSVANMMIEKNKTIEDHGLHSCVSNDARFDMIYPRTNDCINASDFMISDVTSVVGDWLFSMKPFAIIDTTMDRSGFQSANPLALCAYYVDSSLLQLDAVLEDINDGDSLYATRLEQRRYALGVDIDQSPIEKFVIEATDILTNFDKRAFQASLIAAARA